MHRVQKSLVLEYMHTITKALIMAVYSICKFGYLNVRNREEAELNSLMYYPKRLNSPYFK